MFWWLEDLFLDSMDFQTVDAQDLLEISRSESSLMELHKDFPVLMSVLVNCFLGFLGGRSLLLLDSDIYKLISTLHSLPTNTR